MMDNPSVQVFIRHHAGFYRDLADPVAFFRGETESSLAEFWRYPTDTAGVDAQQAVEYSELMAQSQQMVSDQVLAAFSFERCRSLVDIGGGTGAFARAAVERWPHLAVTIADLPPVADIARTVLREAGLERRIDVVGLDAAEDSIPGSYDVASLVRIVHDHDDDKVLRILATAREALTQDGKLLLAEPIAASDAAGRLNDAYFQVYLLAMGSGRPRSYRELKRLLKTAGFGSIRRHRSPVPLISSVLTATR